MLFDADRNRSGFESKKKKKQLALLVVKTAAKPFCILAIAAVFLASSYKLAGDFTEKGRGQGRIVTRSLRESNNMESETPYMSNGTTRQVSVFNRTSNDVVKTSSTMTTRPATTTRVSSSSTELNKSSKSASDDKCPNGPQNNIFFLKTHKAGSTTVQNVLLRYGEKNNATFALPKQSAAHVFNYNVKFSNTMVRPSPTGKYNILCNHLHFHEPGVRQVMPADTKYIAIVRHPIDLFESIMSYYSNDVRAFQRVPGNNIQTRMKNFLDHPLKYYGFDSSHYERFAKNAMMWDFGFDNDVDDDDAIDEWIQYLDKTFDLGLGWDLGPMLQFSNVGWTKAHWIIECGVPFLISLNNGLL